LGGGYGLLARPFGLSCDSLLSVELVDPQARLMVWEMLSSLRARGLTLVLTTHDMDEAARLCDRLAIMDEGRIFAEGTPHDLIAQYAARDVLELAGGD
jgi:lipooligosaccharide transport system ATP-binding protein